MIDIHLHLLPALDDGPPDVPTALEHARRMARDGVTEAAVTPHVGHPEHPFDPADIAGHTRRFQAQLDRARIPLRLRPGGELHPDWVTGYDASDLDHVAHGPRGARWVMLEVPFRGIDEAFLTGCAHVREHGFGLVIAHPERARGILDGGLDLLAGELADGAVLQVNACSLLGRQGAEAHAAARKLVGERLAYVIASDGHGHMGRTHTLAAAVPAALAAGASAVQVRQLTEANPRFLLRHGLPRAAVPAVR
jgi:protein-tyrosine phosphatase